MLASKSLEWPLLVLGDAKTPSAWNLEGARYLSLKDQAELRFNLSPLLPQNHYCRKNLGYLVSIAAGVKYIAETDDDNFPRLWPKGPPEQVLQAPVLAADGWANVYRYFSEETIWPRGLPLTEIHRDLPSWGTLLTERRTVGVHQYLAWGDPDVDAIYRLTVGKDDHEFYDRTLILDRGTAVPFNSQSTIWVRDSFPLLYLPSFVSFRMTDIWRSFIAQVCLWAADMYVAYHGDGVLQKRNFHDLQRDFMQEAIGYERNNEIFAALSALPLKPGVDAIPTNMRACYSELNRIGIMPDKELPLLEAWLSDIASARE